MAGEFLLTLATPADLPKVLKGDYLKGFPEERLAMIGRSNVGKSTLINALLGGSLARVSKQPGKTRAIHFYRWLEARRIVADLPGYGYARVAKDEQKRWSSFINAYLQADDRLAAALVLLDSRHGPTDADREAIRFLSFRDIPVIFVFTKVDALKSQSERAVRMREGTRAVEALGAPEGQVFWVSAKSKEGLVPLARALGT